ncbi:MAG: transcriptional regulator [Actinomycetota bacterium]|jgi:transcriptional regulator with XRE-family HTH domain
MSTSENESLDELSYARLVGERLRQIRQQKKLSLSEVESATNQEFKASVMGAYERGERMISVPRLERLAHFYGVTVDQLLPRDKQREGDTQTNSAAPTKLRIDVAKLTLRDAKEFKMLERLLRMIQVQRQDFNGKVITVRAHDTRAIAVILDVAVDDVGAKLAELDLLFVPPTA